MTKILMIGDNEKAKWHPMTRILPGVHAALDSIVELETTADLAALTPEKLAEYPVIISYIDRYPDIGVLEQYLADYVENGGKILALHNGVINNKGGILEKVYGGNFIKHPQRCTLTYTCSDQSILPGTETFEFFEEPYMVTVDDTPHHVYLTFSYEDKTVETGWVHEYGKGTVLYFSPGHDDRTSNDPAFQKLLADCVKYLLK